MIQIFDRTRQIQILSEKAKIISIVGPQNPQNLRIPPKNREPQIQIISRKPNQGYKIRNEIRKMKTKTHIELIGVASTNRLALIPKLIKEQKPSETILANESGET